MAFKCAGERGKAERQVGSERERDGESEARPDLRSHLHLRRRNAELPSSPAAWCDVALASRNLDIIAFL